MKSKISIFALSFATVCMMSSCLGDKNDTEIVFYDDAAIIEFTEAERDYVVVVMTNYVDYSQIKRLGSEIEAKFMEQIQ